MPIWDSNWEFNLENWEDYDEVLWNTDAAYSQSVVRVQNENYAYSVSTHNDWVVVGNPSSFRYNILSASYFRTGSVDIFKYNEVSDKHDLLLTLFKPVGTGEEILLAEDTSSRFIHTDIYKSAWVPSLSFYSGIPFISWYRWNLENLPIQIDVAGYVSKLEDDYGHSVDVYNNVLAVGSRWHNQRMEIGDVKYHFTGSSVDIYNLTLLNSTPYDGYISTGSGFLSSVISPPLGETVSGSFGFSVSINDEWLAVGSPDWNLTFGAVHLYRRNIPGDPNNLDFTFFTTLTGSSNIIGDYFGYSIDLNKATGSYSGSLIVGCGNKTFAGSKVYYFEFDGNNWNEEYTFEANREVHKLPFYDVNPIYRCEDYTIDGFGNSVALYENDIAIGAPTDRWIYEYSGSRAYKQGAAYLYHRCDVKTRGWRLVKKFYGNDKTIKNNKMGFSVDLWNDKFVLGCPKSNVESMTSCYIQGSIYQQNYCYANLENYIQGQWILFQKNTSSVDIDWDVVNVYQRKKRYLSPYRSFGYDVAVADKNIVIGSPMIISDSNRTLNIQALGNWVGNNYLELEDLTGKAYIYNLNNFRDEFHVGNVFYRNGKIVLNTSGSIFEGLWFNPVNEYSYEYEVHFDSKQTLYEKQIACVIEPGEFNVSTNPTAINKESPLFDVNSNGRFDWQDLDVILRYMSMIYTKNNPGGSTTDWSSSLLKSDDEISYYNYYSSNNNYNTDSGFISQSFFGIVNDIGTSQFDFNQDNKVDLNDMYILWKYYNNRLNQTNYDSYITPNCKRKLFSDITDHLNLVTKKNSTPLIKPEFLTYDDQSSLDRTGSYLAPYVTTIGLYNGLDLVAVAKLGTPIKLTRQLPVNFLIKMDF